jgi:putative cardiolipin synthase
MILISLAGCATVPAVYTRPAPDYAPPARPDGVFSSLEESIRQTHGDESSGFLLLDRNEDGLKWRLALADSARYTLDLQYYIWNGDDSGFLLMKRVIDAADRGVKVRIILDDLKAVLSAAAPEIRDRYFASIIAHPNVEIRLFNTWKSRGIVGRGAEFVARMERLNRRMHNKQMIADNRAAIIGGRNIGDEYTGLNHEFNFMDLDVLGVGPVARHASGVFDRFWNSDWVVPVRDLVEPIPEPDVKAIRESVTQRLQASKKLAGIPVEPKDWRDACGPLQSAMSIGTSRAFTDSPDREAISHHMPQAIREFLLSAGEEVLITNAYIIPGEPSVDGLRQMAGRGVKIRVLTNSLASQEVTAVNSHYKQWRRPLIEAGVQLHEVRPDAAIRKTVADTPPVESEFMSLHTKAIVVDRKRVFIGSMNLDPRSYQINSEMGIIVESTDLAEKLAGITERCMFPENSWRVEIDPEGDLRWVSGFQVLTRQPARSFMQRVKDVIFVLFPRDLY